MKNLTQQWLDWKQRRHIKKIFKAVFIEDPVLGLTVRQKKQRADFEKGIDFKNFRYAMREYLLIPALWLMMIAISFISLANICQSHDEYRIATILGVYYQAIGLGSLIGAVFMGIVMPLKGIIAKLYNHQRGRRISRRILKASFSEIDACHPQSED